MRELIKKIHMYLGLLSFSILVVFGIAGLRATILPRFQDRPKPEASVHFESFTAPDNLTDKQVADRVWEHLKVPLSAPAPPFAIRRNGDNDLGFGFYTPAGVTRVTVLEKEDRLRIESVRNTFWAYLSNLHATTIRAASPDWRVRMWTWYNEFSIWTLLGMSLSGLYLWLSSRPRYRPAQFCFVLGSGCFIVLYLLMR
jgi:hypothetical protein